MGESTKLIESGEVGWPGELRGDGLLLRLVAPLQSLVPAIAACAVDLVDQLHRPPQPQCGQLRKATRPDGVLPGRPEAEQDFTSSAAARRSIDSWAAVMDADANLRTTHDLGICRTAETTRG